MKTAIITGAYGAIGKAIAMGIAANKEYHVFMVGRDLTRLVQAVEYVRRQSGNENVSVALVDLSLNQEIEGFASEFKKPLNILINNASTTPHQRIESAEGIEMQWAVNVLAYYRMINAFTSHLTQAGKARIVNVASYWAGNLDLSDPEFRKRQYHNDTAYRQSKQAERMLTKAFADQLKVKGITVNACHPGDVNSKLSNNLGFGGSESPEEGADTPVWLALAEALDGITGKYFELRNQVFCNFMASTPRVNELVGVCNSYR